MPPQAPRIEQTGRVFVISSVVFRNLVGTRVPPAICRAGSCTSGEWARPWLRSSSGPPCHLRCRSQHICCCTASFLSPGRPLLHPCACGRSTGSCCGRAVHWSEGLGAQVVANWRSTGHPCLVIGSDVDTLFQLVEFVMYIQQHLVGTWVVSCMEFQTNPSLLQGLQIKFLSVMLDGHDMRGTAHDTEDLPLRRGILERDFPLRIHSQGEGQLELVINHRISGVTCHQEGEANKSRITVHTVQKVLTTACQQGAKLQFHRLPRISGDGHVGESSVGSNLDLRTGAQESNGAVF